MSWLDAFFNVGITTVLIAGTPLPTERAINFASGVTGQDNPLAGRLDLTVDGGGGGGGTTYFTTTNVGRTLASLAAQTQPVDTSAAPVTMTANASATEGEIVWLPDASASYGTNALTFNGGGPLVEDPYNQSAAPASSWTSPVGFNRLSPGWQLIKNGSGTLFWKGLASS